MYSKGTVVFWLSIGKLISGGGKNYAFIHSCWFESSGIWPLTVGARLKCTTTTTTPHISSQAESIFIISLPDHILRKWLSLQAHHDTCLELCGHRWWVEGPEVFFTARHKYEANDFLRAVLGTQICKWCPPWFSPEKLPHEKLFLNTYFWRFIVGTSFFWIITTNDS